jgi:predicted acetyltransferase
MKVELTAATMEEHDTLLRNLYQFYMYEFSHFMEWRVTGGGRFEETDLDGCWEKKGRLVFLIKADGQVAGFAIVDVNVPSPMIPGEIIMEMVEFFIMGGFQRQGVGQEAAVTLFNRFPGKWEVFELKKNVNAQHFWRAIIGTYTSSQFTEVTLKSGFVQRFDNSAYAKS